MQILGPQGFGEIEGQIKDLFTNMIPKQRERRKLPVREAREALIAEAQESLLDEDQISRTAVRRAEQGGIVFIDEIDKICGSVNYKGPDVSREGVQRDLLPLVEGSTVSTKYGAVRTDHILFIASGAFHMTKPSDLMPEFQGRFPIRVELQSLSAEHFKLILTEPENALTRQYQELLRTEGVELEFKSEAIDEIAALTAEVNARTENIGARRLHTVLEKLLEEISFTADGRSGEKLVVDRAYVRERLANIAGDSDLARFIL
jgi:ATP-dependent HslUV protease ATP-binding subunit HslU